MGIKSKTEFISGNKTTENKYDQHPKYIILLGFSIGQKTRVNGKREFSATGGFHFMIQSVFKV